MSRSKFIDFKAVKAALTMEQVLEHYGLLHQFKRSGDYLSGPCPIHKGSNATQFRVSIAKNVWNCFSTCKQGGNTLDFIAKMENVSIHAAALKAIEWFGLTAESATPDSEPESEASVEPPKPRSRPPVDTGAPNKPLKFRLDKLERNHPYLTESRGLTLETVVDFGIGFCAKGMMADRIAIPICNPEGNVVAYAGRLPGDPDEGTPKYKLPPGFRKSQELYNIDRAIKEPKDAPLVIVEGFFDCMKLHQLGCRKVVALMGSTLSDAQEELLRQHADCCRHIILLLDEDEAGQAGRDDIAVRLAKFCLVRVWTFDQPGMQPESLSAEEVQKILEDFRAG